MEIDSPAAVLIEVTDQALYLILAGFESKRPERDLELFRLDRS
jgi:hypothetical protein